MIRSLRVRHRFMITVLAAVVPLMFAAGLAARRAVPRSVDSPPAGHTASYEDFEVIGRDDRAWGELPIRTTWLHKPGHAASWAVTLELYGALKRPDLLVYWNDHADDDGRLGEGARLLARLGSRPRVTLDIPTAAGAGRLVLYSTAWKKVVASTTSSPDRGVTR